MNVKNIVLPAAEDAESIWTMKLGFKKMSDEQVILFYTLIDRTVSFFWIHHRMLNPEFAA